MGTARRIAVAYITRAKGVRGEVKAEALTHSLSRFDRLAGIVLQKEGRPDLPLRLEAWRSELPGLRLKFAGIDTPEAARELLVGGYVTVAPDQVAPLPEDTFYHFELIGCAVEDESGRSLGEVVGVQELPSTDVYQVRGERGEVLIPAVGDFIVEVAVAARRIVVRGIEELLPS
jgi:16S rRNA processing protein RimM